MTATVAAALLLLAMLDGAFAGFRASAGRTGLISHRQSDYRAARRGAGLACVLLAPVIAGVCADAVARPAHLDDYARTGTIMMAVYGPYAVLVLIALACYATLSWRLRYLAAALVLGPFTLLRPAVAVLGAALGAALSHDIAAAAAAVLSAVAVLAVEPLAGRLWYSRNPDAGAGGADHAHGWPDVPVDAAGRVVEQPQRGKVVLDRLCGSVQVEHRDQDIRQHVAGNEDAALLHQERRTPQRVRLMLPATLHGRRCWRSGQLPAAGGVVR